MTMTELSRFLMVSNGNVTGIIDRLVAEGMVVRLAHAGDRRATFVRLTPKGAAAVPGHGEGARGLGRRDPRRASAASDTETLIASAAATGGHDAWVPRGAMPRYRSQ